MGGGKDIYLSSSYHFITFVQIVLGAGLTVGVWISSGFTRADAPYTLDILSPRLITRHRIMALKELTKFELQPYEAPRILFVERKQPHSILEVFSLEAEFEDFDEGEEL